MTKNILWYFHVDFSSLSAFEESIESMLRSQVGSCPFSWFWVGLVLAFFELLGTLMTTSGVRCDEISIVLF